MAKRCMVIDRLSARISFCVRITVTMKITVKISRPMATRLDSARMIWASW